MKIFQDLDTVLHFAKLWKSTFSKRTLRPFLVERVPPEVNGCSLLAQDRASLPAWEHGIDVLAVTHESPNPYLGQVNNHCCSEDKVFRSNTIH